MTKKEFADKMYKLLNSDTNFPDEEPHFSADELLCQALTELGYSEGVALYQKINKIYC